MNAMLELVGNHCPAGIYDLQCDHIDAMLLSFRYIPNESRCSPYIVIFYVVAMFHRSDCDCCHNLLH